MQPIPLKLRKQIADSGLMDICIHNNCDCQGRVEWEHSWTYGKHQIQEEWSIVPVCTYHHRGNGLDKDFNRYKSLLKAIELEGSLIPLIRKYPKKNWQQEWKFLSKKYE